MVNSATVADIFGTLGAVCWSIQLLPQIHQNYRLKSTLGLQPTMMLLWSVAGIPLGIYNITRSFPVALQVQPQILTFLSLVTWMQTRYYPPARDVKVRSVSWCVVVLIVLCILAGGIEAGVVFGLRYATRDMIDAEKEWYPPVALMGVLSGVLLCAGVGWHYVDIYRERTVRGVSLLFCGIDALGDLTSLVGVVVQGRGVDDGRVDVLGCVIYAGELVLWLGVFACAAWFDLPGWMRRNMVEWRGEEEGRAADAEVRRDGGGASVGAEGTAEARRAGSVSSGTSLVSRVSGLSGSAFRTTSGRVVSHEGQDIGIEGRRHDSLRLRNVVQLGV